MVARIDGWQSVFTFVFVFVFVLCLHLCFNQIHLISYTLPDDSASDTDRDEECSADDDNEDEECSEEDEDDNAESSLDCELIAACACMTSDGSTIFTAPYW